VRCIEHSKSSVQVGVELKTPRMRQKSGIASAAWFVGSNLNESCECDYSKLHSARCFVLLVSGARLQAMTSVVPEAGGGSTKTISTASGQKRSHADMTSFDTTPVAPIHATDRVVGMTYRTNRGDLAIWREDGFRCLHEKWRYKCAECQKPKRKKTTLKESHPELEAEWVEEENGKMEDYLTHSNKVVSWRCSKGHTFRVSPQKRTQHSPPSGCRECWVDSTRKMDKEVKRAFQQAQRPENSTVEIGDEAEEYVMKVLKREGCFADVCRIGATGDKADLVVTLASGEQKSLQVKTLTRRQQTQPDRLKFTVDSRDQQYAGDLLIAAVDKERKYFVVNFAQHLGTGFVFGYDQCRHRDSMFTDEKAFVRRIATLLPSAAAMTFGKCASHQKEFAMTGRFAKFCVNHDLSFRPNDTAGNTVDGFVGDIPVQLKYRGKHCANQSTYHVGTKKQAGRLKGKSIARPYDESDPFDFIIVELGGDDEHPTKWHGQFCIIPKAELVRQKILRNATCDGKVTMSICPPDYSLKRQWSKRFWNAVDLLKPTAC
jgi:hypothetical protein